MNPRGRLSGTRRRGVNSRRKCEPKTLSAWPVTTHKRRPKKNRRDDDEDRDFNATNGVLQHAHSHAASLARLYNPRKCLGSSERMHGRERR